MLYTKLLSNNFKIIKHCVIQPQRGKKSDRWKDAETKVLVNKEFEFFDIISRET